MSPQARWLDRHPEYRRAYYLAHREEILAKGRARYAKDPTGEQLRKRMTKYGVDAEMFAEYLDAQEGACALCGEEFGTARISIDHDHATGAVRGLVHQGCNVAIGLYEKHADHLAGYLAAVAA